MREGRRIRAVARVEDVPRPHDTLRQISTLSLSAIAIIAIGCVLYLGRELFLPIVAAFVVGVMLSPIAARIEALRVPRLISALLIVCGFAVLIAFVILLIMPRVNELTDGLPALGQALREKLHAFDGVFSYWGRVTSALGEKGTSSESSLPMPLPSISWVPTTLGALVPPITEFFFFLVVLLLFISGWPELRRGLVMTFASRDSRLTVLKILNEIESGAREISPLHRASTSLSARSPARSVRLSACRMRSDSERWRRRSISSRSLAPWRLSWSFCWLASSPSRLGGAGSSARRGSRS